jgi:hypothetical protein
VTLSLFSLINTPSPGGERGGDDKRETKNRGKREEIEQNQKKQNIGEQRKKKEREGKRRNIRERRENREKKRKNSSASHHLFSLYQLRCSICEPSLLCVIATTMLQDYEPPSTSETTFQCHRQVSFPLFLLLFFFFYLLPISTVLLVISEVNYNSLSTVPRPDQCRLEPKWLGQVCPSFPLRQSLLG